MLDFYNEKKSQSRNSYERKTIIFNPLSLLLDVLENIFHHFGNVMEAYLVSGKIVGYAKFADRMSANDAILTLHGKILNENLKLRWQIPQGKSLIKDKGLTDSQKQDEIMT